jgi:hypothetical protein
MAKEFTVTLSATDAAFICAALVFQTNAIDNLDDTDREHVMALVDRLSKPFGANWEKLQRAYLALEEQKDENSHH